MNDFLNRELFKVDGFTLTVSLLVILVLVGWILVGLPKKKR